MPAADASAELHKLKGNQMRNLIFGINITIDGCCDHTKLRQKP